ncbi:MAG: hypothetical protein KAS17_10215 [Victivallaceae bacterium]|nr:hypothetical protein [Victivallaceae bacterium]
MTDEMVNIISGYLRYFSYASITGAFLFGVFKARATGLAERIIFTAFLTAFIAFYNPIVDDGTKIFEDMTAASDSKIDAYLNRCRTVRFEGDSGFIDDFITSLQANFFKVLLSCTFVLRFISGFIQMFFIVAFKIMAPIVLGLSAWEVFRSRLYQFITYTLAVMMWSIGYQIADIFILKGIALIGVPSALNSSAGVMVVSGGGALIGLLVFLLALLIGMCIFYILTPVLMFSILSGANPGTAVISNMRTASLASMAVSRPISMLARKSVSKASNSTNQNRTTSQSSPNANKNNTTTPAVSLKSVTQAMGKKK